MLPNSSLLVRLLRVVDRVPMPSPSPRRGRPTLYSDRLIVKALAVMIIRRLHSSHALLAFLEQDDIVARRVAELLCEGGRRPSRRTFERRLEAVADRLPELIGMLGRCLVEAVLPERDRTLIAAADSTALRTCGGVWHRKDREAGQVPHTSIDCEAGWSKSGWHGWWYGWKLHLVVTAGKLWIPMASELTVANVSDNVIAPALLAQLPDGLRLLLGDSQYRDPKLDEQCDRRGCVLVTPRLGPYPHRDKGIELRRQLHRLRSKSIEPFNGRYKDVFGWRTQMPVKGLVKTKLLALGAVFVYQVVLRYQHENQLPLGKGIKALLRAA
jgi:Transposase DDE domain